MTNRIHCCVVGCKRTRKPNPFPEWICGVHWKMVSKKTRAEHRASNYALRRAILINPMVSTYWKMKPGSPERLAAVQMWATSAEIWERCKIEAVERAMGL